MWQVLYVCFLGNFPSSRSSLLKGFCKKGVFLELKGKHLCQGLFSNKVACFKKRLVHRSFSVNAAKFLRTAMFVELPHRFASGAAKFQVTFISPLLNQFFFNCLHTQKKKIKNMLFSYLLAHPFLIS